MIKELNQNLNKNLNKNLNQLKKELEKDLELTNDFNEMTYIYLEIQRIENLLKEDK